MEMFTDSWIYRGIYAEITLVWTLYCAVLLCDVVFRWKITLLYVYMLNLWLHMQNPHYHSSHIALEQGTWCWLLTAARYIALSLISRYLSWTPTTAIYWAYTVLGYYLVALSLSQVTATHLKIGHPSTSPAGACCVLQTSCRDLP